MKLLLVSGHPAGSVTGLGLQFEMLVTGLRNLDVSCTVVEKAAMPEHLRQGAFNFVHAFHTLRSILRVWFSLSGVDLVYMPVASSRMGFLRDALVVWAARLMGRRVVLQLHGGGYLAFYEAQPRVMKALVRRTLGLANTLIVEGELLREQFGFVPGAGAKVKVVPNGLPDGLRPDMVVPRDLPASGEPVRLLYLANMIESKGYLEVLDACRMLKEAGVSFQCDFCGGFVKTVVDTGAESAEDARKAFLALIRDWGLTEQARYRGVVTGGRKEEFLSQAHLLLFPTAYPWEGQPVSIIEALAYGIPVITTRYRGIPEEIVDGWNGVFVRSGAPAEMVDAVRRILADEKLYGRLSRNAMEHFAAHFTREAHLSKLIPVLFGTGEGGVAPRACDHVSTMSGV